MRPGTGSRRPEPPDAPHPRATHIRHRRITCPIGARWRAHRRPFRGMFVPRRLERGSPHPNPNAPRCGSPPSFGRLSTGQDFGRKPDPHPSAQRPCPSPDGRQFLCRRRPPVAPMRAPNPSSKRSVRGANRIRNAPVSRPIRNWSRSADAPFQSTSCATPARNRHSFAPERTRSESRRNHSTARRGNGCATPVILPHGINATR